MKLELHNMNISTCSQKTRMCLAEKNLDYEDIQVNLSKGEHLKPEYLAINPNGLVPTLVVNDQAIGDSSVICEYLEEVHPEPALVPADPMDRARMREWMRYLEEIPTPAVRVPSFNVLFANVFNAQSLAATAGKRPLRKDFYLEMGPDGFSQERIDTALKLLRQTVERVDAAVKKSNAWLCGDQFTLADITLLPSVVRLDDLGHQDLWQDLEYMTDWYQRIQQRPSFAKAYTPDSRLQRR